MVVVHIFYRQI